MTTGFELLLAPPRLWSRDEVLSTACVPRSGGVYAWYFRDSPQLVPLAGCIVRGDFALLYAGIAPKAPPKAGRPSSQTLFHRIRYHMQGNAEGSTLRLTLGCLLGLELRRIGSGERRTFADQERQLSDWLDRNARVCWMETSEPWLVEKELIRSACLPLNLDQNRAHPFHAVLSEIRRTSKRRADDRPVWMLNQLDSTRSLS